MQTCNQCVMDITDPGIKFDHEGVCNNCYDFNKNVAPNWNLKKQDRFWLEKKVEEVKRVSRGKEYDTILGLSGGLDSSYLLHKMVTEYELKPLVFHVDAGWNTDIAVGNIRKLVDTLGLDLYTEVIDWDDMRDFQLALFRSGTPHLDLAQDHAFFATMYHYARKHKINHILNGGNHSTECVRNPLMWIYYGTDMRFLKDVRRQFCDSPLTNYPWSNVYYHKIFLRYFKKIEVLKPLNFMPYTKNIAINELRKFYGWQSYPQKHFESRFTRFYESFWMPKRFNYDTRKVQLSSLILTGQMDRKEALEILSEPPFTEEFEKNEMEYVANKLEVTTEYMYYLLNMEKKWYFNYKNSKRIFDIGALGWNLLNKDKASVKR